MSDVYDNEALRVAAGEALAHCQITFLPRWERLARLALGAVAEVDRRRADAERAALGFGVPSTEALIEALIETVRALAASLADTCEEPGPCFVGYDDRGEPMLKGVMCSGCGGVGDDAADISHTADDCLYVARKEAIACALALLP